MNLARYYDRFLMNDWLLMPQSLQATFAALLALRGHMGTMMPGMPGMPEAPDDDPDCLTYSCGNDGVAYLPISGKMVVRPDEFEKEYLGMVCMEEAGNAIRQACDDPKVKALLLHMDSPGGTANGTPELAALVKECAGKKPIVAYSDTLACSAAYYVASQATTVLSSVTASLGNVGSVMTYMDISKMLSDIGVKPVVIRNEDSPLKGTGALGTSLTAEQLAFLQRDVNESAAMFKRAVKSARNCTDDAMDGGWYSGARAMALGLTDQLCDMRTARKTAAQLAH
jgi:signal peptide peptidase SppA